MGALAKLTRALRLTANTLTTQGTLAQDNPMQTITDPLSAILSKIDVLGRRLAAVERQLEPLQWITAHETTTQALERKRQLDTLEKFLSSRSVSDDLSGRIMTCVRERLQAPSGLEPHDVELLSLLSEELQEELRLFSA